MAVPSESDAVSDTYHVALSIIGARIMQNSMTLWMEEVPVVAQSHTAMLRWYSAALKLVTLGQKQAEELAYKYIRLNRALNVGSTLATPDDDDEDPVSLDDLRSDFVATVKEYAPEALKANPVADTMPEEAVSSEKSKEPLATTSKAKTQSTSQKPSGAPRVASQPTPDTSGPQGFESASGGRYKPYTGKGSDYSTEAPETVEVDKIPSLAEVREQRRKAAQAEAEMILQQVGAKRLTVRQAKVVDNQQESATEHVKVGAAVAQHVDRMVMNGGRATEMDVGLKDKKVLAFARVHEPHGDTSPCGFCAMLLSRGAVYKSKSSAGTGELSQYHAGDHCRAEAVYSKKQYNESARFDANRKYAKLWRDSQLGNLPNDYGFTGLKEFRRQVRDLADRESASNKTTNSGRIR